ncbi:MAG TPA: YcfL family protein [Phycisphaerae bacterium]|nr:YcfL family protein [Phycisphaerae bacterium]
MAAAGVVGGCLFAGCAGPIAARQDDLTQYPQVLVDAYSLHEAIVVQPPVTNRVGAGQLHVAVPIRNKWDRDLHLQYQYWFINQQGATVEPKSPWMDFTVPRKGIDQFDFTSMGPMAADFRVELREAK